MAPRDLTVAPPPPLRRCRQPARPPCRVAMRSAGWRLAASLLVTASAALAAVQDGFCADAVAAGSGEPGAWQWLGDQASGGGRWLPAGSCCWSALHMTAERCACTPWLLLASSLAFKQPARFPSGPFKGVPPTHIACCAQRRSSAPRTCPPRCGTPRWRRLTSGTCTAWNRAQRLGCPAASRSAWRQWPAVCRWAQLRRRCGTIHTPAGWPATGGCTNAPAVGQQVVTRHAHPPAAACRPRPPSPVLSYELHLRLRQLCGLSCAAAVAATSSRSLSGCPCLP